MCCALSRLFSSLAFAGFAAAAKPNQRFFVCQQLGRFFFASSPRPRCPPPATRCPHRVACMPPRAVGKFLSREKSACFKAFSIMRRVHDLPMRTHTARHPRARTEAERRHSGMCAPCEENSPLARRTSSIARICASARAAGCAARKVVPPVVAMAVAVSMAMAVAVDTARVAGGRTCAGARSDDARLRCRDRMRCSGRSPMPKNEEGRGVPRPSTCTT